MDALEKFGEHSKTKSCSWLRLELLLRIIGALQTSRVHPELDIRTLSMNKFLNFTDVLYCRVCWVDWRSWPESANWYVEEFPGFFFLFFSSNAVKLGSHDSKRKRESIKNFFVLLCLHLCNPLSIEDTAWKNLNYH